MLEINHIFVCLKEAPSKLVEENIGLICSDKIIRHPQQGTSSQLIFFENVYLELIWIENITMAEIYAIYSSIDFIARSYSPENLYSPFGIALRQKADFVYPKDSYLSSFNYQPQEQFINFAVDNFAAQTEPICFMIPESISFLNIFNPLLEEHQQLINHPLGIKKITNTHVSMSQKGNLSNPISMLQREGIIEIELNTSPLLELTFDYGIRGKSLDLKSIGIPIILKY